MKSASWRTELLVPARDLREGGRPGGMLLGPDGRKRVRSRGRSTKGTGVGVEEQSVRKRGGEQTRKNERKKVCEGLQGPEHGPDDAIYARANRLGQICRRSSDRAKTPSSPGGFGETGHSARTHDEWQSALYFQQVCTLTVRFLSCRARLSYLARLHFPGLLDPISCPRQTALLDVHDRHGSRRCRHPCLFPSAAVYLNPTRTPLLFFCQTDF